MYKFLEYSSNYLDTAGSVWFYSKDNATNFNADIRNNSSIDVEGFRTFYTWEQSKP